MKKKLFVMGLVCVIACCAVMMRPCCDGSAVMAADGAELRVTAKAAFLMEANSGRVLFSQDADKQLPIASMVKIGVLAVIYDALEAGEIALDEMVTVSQAASGMGGSQAFLDANSEYSVDELIKSIIVASANDSCVALAERIAGSESEFVNRMNALAQRLGMTGTNFVNVTGLPAPGAVSTASDVAKIYAYTMKSQYYGRHELVWMYDLTHPGGRITGLTNTNKHTRFFNGITGGKTGFTSEAGHCLAVSATRGNLRPIAVVIGATDSKTRFAETANMMNYVFGAYQNELIVSKDTVLIEVKVGKSMVDKIELFARDNFYDLVKKGDKSQPEIRIEPLEDIAAPLGAADALGKVVVVREGKAVAEIDLVTGIDIEKLNYWTSVQKVARKFKLAA
ncbi:MAG: D-alanyl-D-alanine carboxypeptidase [Firmicutes bacterium]|nr:D-alanyl-D-alanine carboxypeptidase [Bacillota bacterium]